MSAAKTEISTAEKEYQAFKDELDILDQVKACILFPPESDFTEVCSCDDCLPKIEKLNQFQKDMKAKRDLIHAYKWQMDDKQDLCFSIYASAEWTNQTLDLFHKKLEAISEKPGVQCKLVKSDSASKLEEVDKEIAEILRKFHLLGQPNKKYSDVADDHHAIDDDAGDGDVIEEIDSGEKDPDVAAAADDDDDDDDATDDDVDDVIREIDRGLYYYNETELKDKANITLRNIEKLEKDHKMEKEAAQSQNKTLDPAVSKKYIEDQIKLLKELPVEKLQQEVQKLIFEIRPDDDIDNTHQMKFGKARQAMYKICFSMIRKRIKFWRRYSSLATKGNEHDLNGLKETLDSLMDEVKSFEDHWEKDHAPAFTAFGRAFYRSDPKRQRVK